jgi:hypothetical protein
MGFFWGVNFPQPAKGIKTISFGTFSARESSNPLEPLHRIVAPAVAIDWAWSN